MKIGIDLDGVVFDSENTFRTYEEIFEIEKGINKITDRTEPKFQDRYNWTEEEQKEFINKYFIRVSRESGLKAGFKTIYNLIKKYSDIELIVITARGGFVKEMKDDAERILKENNIVFDRYYWRQNDKVEICKKENIDLMIDDDYKVVEKLADNEIKTLYFRDVGLKKLEENEYIKEVNNWGDIYRKIINVRRLNEK